MVVDTGEAGLAPSSWSFAIVGSSGLLMGRRRASYDRNLRGGHHDEVAAAAGYPGRPRGLAPALVYEALVLEMAAWEAQGLGRGSDPPGDGSASTRSAIHRC